MLLGCYRSGDANDPEVYATAIMAVFSGYPVHVIEAVIEPSRGLPSKIQFLPTVAEVKGACEIAYGAERYAAQWDATARAQIAPTEARKAIAGPPPAPRPTREDLLAKHGPRFGLHPNENDEAAKAAHVAAIVEGNRQALIAEYAKAGLAVPASEWAPSPALLATELVQRGRVRQSEDVGPY